MAENLGRKHPLAQCEVCPYQTIGKYVPSLFPTKPIKLSVVGEAPGPQEAKTGIPFTGPSGDLLNAVLKHHGVEREETFLTNICSCRPHGPTEAPPKDAVAACANRLRYEIEATRPGGGNGRSTIIAVGGTAAKALLDDSRKISGLRVGPPKRSPHFDNVEVIATWHPAFCVGPETRILTSSLRWEQIQDIKVGDELIGFDEEPPGLPGEYTKRQLHPSIVLTKELLKLPSYKVTTSLGSVVASSDHMWLVRRDTPYYSPPEWVRTDRLTKRPYQILHYVEPWEQVDTRMAGYIAGFLDGEGWISGSQAAWAQNDGPISEAMLGYVESFGFSITKYRVSGSPKTGKYFFKGKQDSLRALGMFRPERLVTNARKLWEGRQASNRSVPIESVEFLGEHEVVAISTSTKTFIAEGFLSHNCLRSPDAFPSFVRDIGKLHGVKHGTWVEPEFRVFDTPDVALLALQRLIDGVRLVVVDIEVGIEKDFNFAHPEDYDLLCVGIAYAKSKAVVLGENSLKDRRVLDKLRELLSRVKVVAHNGKFDLRGLSPVVGVQPLWFDTMLASYAIDERPGQHGLKVLAIERLGAPAYDEEVQKYVGKGKGKSYANIPRPILYKYNAYDVCCTWDLYELFTVELGERGRRAHDFMVEAANEIIHLELAGIHFDHDYSAELADDYLDQIADTEKEIVDCVGYYVNPRSPKQIQAYLLKKGIRAKTTNKDFLAEIRPFMTGEKEEVGRFIDILSKNRKASKLYGTYIKGLSQRTTHGNIYTTYLLHGTTSGRLASRNPNMQNIVRNKPIRNQFTVSSRDNVLIQLDYKQAEGRVITTLARDEYLRSIFQDPSRDIFDELTERVYGAGNWAKEERVKIKTFFYGLSYGREAPSIAREFDMPLDEAHELLSSFKALIPATVAWQSAVSHKVLSGEDLVTPFGRKRSFHLITDENKKDVLNEALSFLPQSIASDICLSALIRLRPMLENLATLRLSIHDAIVAECHKDRSDEVIEVMQREMMASGREFTDYVPFAVDATIGTRLGEL